MAVAEVAVVSPELYRLFEPAPVLPSHSEYPLAPVAADQLNVTLGPVSTELGVGDVSALWPVSAEGTTQKNSRSMQIRPQV